MNKSTFVIGDVHGCFYTLLELVSKLPKNCNLIFVGDLCDYGLYTKEVINFIIENNHKAVLGNHDVHMYLNLKDALNNKHSAWSTSKKYSGFTTVNSYKQASNELIEKHLTWLKSLPTSIKIGNYLITHGFGLPFYNTNLKKKKFLMRVNRITSTKYNELYSKDYKTQNIINIFGHDAFNSVQTTPYYYAIDTNCKNGNKLSAIELGTLNIIDTITNKKDLN